MNHPNLIKLFAILGLSNILVAGFSPRVLSNGITGQSNLQFSVIAGNKIFINNGGNFEGNPDNPNDDALIYAGNGFTMNALDRTSLPSKRDGNGNLLLENNLKVLVDNAVSVNSSNPQINAPNNPYSNLTPPPKVEEQTIELPSYETLKTEEISKRSTSSDITSFNPGANPINSLNDWNNLFPAPGSAEQPTIVNVTSGLNIPDNVNLENYIITVNGTVNFNGFSSLNNVVLIVNNGGINLGNTRIHNSAIFAPNTININNTARFSGESLVASNSAVNFDGATTTTKVEDQLKIVAQGAITYNAFLDSNASLWSGNDVNFNANTSLHGLIVANSDIRCNSNCAIVGVSAATSTPANNNDPLSSDYPIFFAD